MSTPGRSLLEITDPHLIRLGDWFYQGWQVQATCSCGRVSIVHRGELIRRYGEGMFFNAERLAAIPVKCIRCGERHPKLEIVREG